MRKLDVEQLKLLMTDHMHYLVALSPTERRWFIEDDVDHREEVELTREAEDELAKWMEEAAIHYDIFPGGKKVVYDAWRSVQAYGKQPHSGYLKAAEYGMQRNTEHFDDEVKQMEEFKPSVC